MESVAGRFYKEFQEQHAAFLSLIAGIADARERRWYASVLLNRLMFVYFLQRKGFVKGHAQGGDDDYLRRKLAESRRRGVDQYYGKFLRALFFKGFGAPEDVRAEGVRRRLGGVPYLGGGLFEPHPIERRNPRIRVPDAAFEQLYEFFGGYAWNLGDAPSGRADEINPDVLGHVFEKHVNQKAFGAYYTRPEITEYLCEQTVHKLILDRVNHPDGKGDRTNDESSDGDAAGAAPSLLNRPLLNRHARFSSMPELLSGLDASLCRRLLDEVLPGLKLLDPACGSGAFLVAALETLAKVYAAVVGRAASLGDRQLEAKLAGWRDAHGSYGYFIRKRVITENLFGVDILEESVEVAKFRLFLALAASAQGAAQLGPLPDVDLNLLAGNALVGLLRVDGDDEAGGRARGTPPGATGGDLLARKNRLVEQRRRAEVAAPRRLRALRERIREQRRAAAGALNDRLRREFAEMGVRFEQATWDAAEDSEGQPRRRDVTREDIEAMQPFHWGYEFDRIVGGGGFDAIITNPPWEIFKPQAKEFFAEHSGLVTKNRMTLREFEQERARLLRRPDVRGAWLAYRSRFPHLSHYFRSSPQYRHQTSFVNGRKAGADINLYKLFVEQCFNLLRRGGACGLVVPGGICTDLGAKRLRELLFGETEITGLFGFENREFIFEGVDSRFKFVVLTFGKGRATDTFPAAFMRRRVEELARFPGAGGLRLSVGLVRRLSPVSLSLLEFRDARDVRIAEKMLRFPLLCERVEGRWNVALTNEFHMTNDSRLFKNSPGARRLPLYEGRTVYQFSHTFAGPRHWVDEREGRRALLGRARDDGQTMDYQSYRLGFRDIARNTDHRTLIGAIIPPAFHGNKFPTVKVFDAGGRRVIGDRTQLFLCAVWNSFVIDAALRMRVATTLNFFHVYQLPVPRLDEEDAAFAPVVRLAARLVCTAPEFDGLAREAGLRGHADGVTDPAARARLRAELDARVANLYGLTEEEFAHVLSAFPLVAQPVKDAALAEFRRQAAK